MSLTEIQAEIVRLSASEQRLAGDRVAPAHARKQLPQRTQRAIDRGGDALVVFSANVFRK